MTNENYIIVMFVSHTPGTQEKKKGTRSMFYVNVCTFSSSISSFLLAHSKRSRLFHKILIFIFFLFQFIVQVLVERDT